MGNRLFGVDISGIIAREVGSGVLDATLSAITLGTRTATNLTGGTQPTSTPHTCKGFIDQQRRDRVGGTLIEDGDVVIVLLGDTINSGNTAPQIDDEVTIEGTIYLVKALGRDPAKAAYELLCTES